jgi:hypothetical protein
VVSADYDPIFAIMASAEDGWRINTDVVEVDGRVTGGINCPELAIGLFH